MVTDYIWMPLHYIVFNHKTLSVAGMQCCVGACFECNTFAVRAVHSLFSKTKSPTHFAYQRIRKSVKVDLLDVLDLLDAWCTLHIAR